MKLTPTSARFAVGEDGNRYWKDSAGVWRRVTHYPPSRFLNYSASFTATATPVSKVMLTFTDEPRTVYEVGA